MYKDVTEVNSYFLVEFKSHSIGGNTCLSLYWTQSMVGELTGFRNESTTVILVNEHSITLLSKFFSLIN